MAELGSGFLLPSDERKVDVSVEMLDYDYIGKCTDTKKLRGILEVLESGAEGHYPDLVKCAEARLLSLLPEKERVKILRLRHKTTPQEVIEAETELERRRREILAKDSLLLASKPLPDPETTAAAGNGHSSIFTSDDVVRSTIPSSNKKLPPVRGSSSVAVTATIAKPQTADAGGSGAASDANKAQRISGYDFKAWEKFDVDAACEDVEPAEVGAPSISTQKTVDLVAAAAEKRAAAHKKEMDQLHAELAVSSLSPVQRSTRAAREKLKGNECHKVNENDEAFACYSRSLALDSSSAIVYANRAVTCIRLERFELAEDDCSRALQIDPTYIKAWVRRGMARFKRGKYKEAFSDFEEAALKDPSSSEFRNLAENAAAKYLEVEGRPLPSRLVPRTPPQIAPVAITFTELQDPEKLPLPSASAVEIARGSYVVVQPAAQATEEPGFTRIAICEDDDDEEEEEKGEEEADPTNSAGGSFTRVSIVEEDDEGDGEGDGGALQAAEQLKDRGNACWALGDHEGALKAYSESLALSPDMLASLNNRALVLISMKRYDEAVADATRVLDKEPSNIKALYRRAVALRSLDKIDAARADLGALTKIDPANGQALKLLEELTPAPEVSAGPQLTTEWDVDLLKQRAMRELGDGNFSAAITMLEKALASPIFELPPKASTLSVEAHVSILSLLSSAVSAVENYPRTVEVCNRILSLQVRNFKALQRRADAYVKLGDKEAAVADLRGILQIEPSNAEAIATINHLQGKPAAEVGGKEDGASQDIQKLAASVRLKDRGNEAMSKHLYVEAVGFYTESIANDAENITSYNNRAQAFLKLSRFIEAERDAAVVMDACGEDRTSPHFKKAAFRRALASRGMGGKVNVSKAADLLSELVKLDPDNKEFKLEHGRTMQLQMEVMKGKDSPGLSNPISPSVDMSERTSTKRVPPAAPPASPDAEPMATAQAILPPPPPAEKEGGASRPARAPSAKKALMSPPGALRITPEVPQTPPATLYELERHWRALKSNPQLFAEYLKTFKTSTFKKVFKESLSSELISSMLVALRDYSDAPSIVAVLGGLAQSSGFDMMVMMLPADDAHNLGAIFSKLDGEDAEVKLLKAKFKVAC